MEGFGEGEINNIEGSFRDNDEKAFTSKDYRFTYKNGYLYAFCMHPDPKEFCISSLKIKGEFDIVTGKVEALGSYSVTECNRDTEGLHIFIDKMPASDKPIGFKIEII